MYFKNLRNLREDNDLTQEQVAAILKCRRNVYGRYKRGEREIPVSLVIVLANYYGVTTDFLLEQD